MKIIDSCSVRAITILGLLGLLSISFVFSSVSAAPLKSQSAIPTNNIVSTTSTYEILFTTATTGTIKTIEITFPAGFSVVGTGVIERAGVGHGILQKSGTTVVYSITSPVSIPANTPIRLELANIVNSNIKAAASVSITTRDSAGTIIDGPTLSSTFIRNIGANDIASSAITTVKIGANAVTSAKIADQSVFTNDLADNAVTGNKIAGIDRLLFVSCVIDFPRINSAAFAEGTCDAPGAAVGDSVVFGHDQCAGLLIVDGPRVYSTGIDEVGVRFLVRNIYTSSFDPAPGAWHFIVFHKK